MVRIHLPPAESPQTIGSAGDFTGSLEPTVRNLLDSVKRPRVKAPFLSRDDGLLTPPSTLLAIRAGYRPVPHPGLEASPCVGMRCSDSASQGRGI
jgi:hypothetical protein